MIVREKGPQSCGEDLRVRANLAIYHPVWDLHSQTTPAWVDVALGDFNALLIDHCHCEKKAAASAMMLVSHYPDHDVLVRRCVKLAQEELRHFQQVHEVIVQRGLTLGHDMGDPYARALLSHVQKGGDGLSLCRRLRPCLWLRLWLRFGP
jgi:tRNA isopentenyl-2-thiomethyl-A-37 hydroxylase MiaE